jgi:hypothetical protein
LECADSLDGILKIVEARKPTVEVIEVAADVTADDEPEAAIEIVTADKVITAVAAVKPAEKPVAATANAEPEVEKKSPSVIQIQRTLMKIGRDKKRHPQLIQIARDAVQRMTAADRVDFLASRIVWLEPNEQRLLQDAVREKQDALDAEAESYGQ